MEEAIPLVQAPAFQEIRDKVAVYSSDPESDRILEERLVPSNSLSLVYCLCAL